MEIETSGFGAPRAMFPPRRRRKTRRRRYKASHLAAFLIGAFALLFLLLTWGVLILPRWL
jgi:hypothetical protein